MFFYFVYDPNRKLNSLLVPLKFRYQHGNSAWWVVWVGRSPPKL